MTMIIPFPATRSSTSIFLFNIHFPKLFRFLLPILLAYIRAEIGLGMWIPVPVEVDDTIPYLPDVPTVSTSA